MKNSKILALVFLAMTISYSAYARKEGNGAGNGGTVVICPGKPTELAELLEVKVRPGLSKMKIVRDEKSVDEQIKEKLSILSEVRPFFARSMALAIQNIRKAAVFYKDYQWANTTDAILLPIPKGCELKTVVHYFSREMIEVDENTYETLSNTDKAALWIHEAAYAFGRDRTDVQDTLATRRLVSMLFSENPNKVILSDLINTFFERNDVIIEDRYFFPQKIVIVSKVRNAKVIYEEMLNFDMTSIAREKFKFGKGYVVSPSTIAKYGVKLIVAYKKAKKDTTLTIELHDLTGEVIGYVPYKDSNSWGSRSFQNIGFVYDSRNMYKYLWGNL